MTTNLAQARLGSHIYKEHDMPAFFRISIYKDWLALSDAPWVNTYEIQSDQNLTPAEIGGAGVVELLAGAEKELHLTSVLFDRGVISSYAEDSNPYNPASFVTVPLSGFGTRSVFTDALDLNAVFKVRRVVGSGRSGKLAYRGCLAEADVSANNSGRWSLSAGSSINSGGADWLAYLAIIASLLDGTVEPQMTMLTPGGNVGTPAFARQVDALVPAGVGFNRKNHRWFNSP
jgi:hypothetical protein